MNAIFSSSHSPASRRNRYLAQLLCKFPLVNLSRVSYLHKKSSPTHGSSKVLRLKSPQQEQNLKPLMRISSMSDLRFEDSGDRRVLNLKAIRSTKSSAKPAASWNMTGLRWHHQVTSCPSSPSNRHILNVTSDSPSSHRTLVRTSLGKLYQGLVLRRQGLSTRSLANAVQPQEQEQSKPPLLRFSSLRIHPLILSSNNKYSVRIPTKKSESGSPKHLIRLPSCTFLKIEDTPRSVLSPREDRA